MTKYLLAAAAVAAIGFCGAAFAGELGTTTTSPAAMSDAEMDGITDPVLAAAVVAASAAGKVGVAKRGSRAPRPQPRCGHAGSADHGAPPCSPGAAFAESLATAASQMAPHGAWPKRRLSGRRERWRQRKHRRSPPARGAR